jgi:tetratricopeptide (TPR) repeat protein
MRPEVITILKALAQKSQSAIAMEKKTLGRLAERQDLLPFIDDLKTEIQKTKDTHDDRIPFYSFYLAVILLKQNLVEEAKDALSDAIHGFRILGWGQNEAMGEWLFSIIHYENEDHDRAQRACEHAIEILRSLIKQYGTESKYEHAKELSAYLTQLELFQDSIMAAAYSSKSFLGDYKNKLENKREYLKRHKKRIPYTLVAAIFYLYKMITPSHSAYRTVPTPATDREKEVYDTILKKVVFFEVIEQLVELEKESTPTASREELLERINLEWDEEISQQ